MHLLKTMHLTAVCAYCEKKRQRQILWKFQQLVPQLLCILRYVCKYFFELLGSIILSACLVLDFVASLAIILPVRLYGKFQIPLAILR